MEIRTTWKQVDKIQTQIIEFGVRDPKGRAVGMAVWRSEVEFTEIPAEQSWGYRTSPGRYFRVEVSITRDGKPFGASSASSGEDFTTEAERAAWIEARVERSRKAMTKKFGRT